MRQHPTRARFILALPAALGISSAVSFVAAPAFAGDKPATAAPSAPKDKDKGKGNAKAKDVPRADLAELAKKLSGDEDTAVATLQEIAEKGDPETAPVVGALLERGSTPKVLDAALKTAAKLKVDTLSPAIAPYVQHRSEEIRRGAVKALLKTKGSAAVDALKNALKSSDPVVRGTAATGLGTLGTKEALPDLFKAFDHGVAEAGASIGQLCTPEQCESFAERTGKVAFDVMVTGFDQILFRAPTDIPDEEKIRLIGRMRELGTPEVGKYLADVGDRWPKDWSKKLKQAIDSAARAIGAGAKK
jgi:hypothetical protein